MARKKARGKKKKKVSVDVTLRLNVELEQDKARPKRVKRITSRRRPNLREMRQGMGGTLQQQMSAPNFFGNTAMLSNAAMSAMNNKSYALERQIRDNQSEIKAFIQAGRGDNAQVRQLQGDNQALLQNLEQTRNTLSQRDQKLLQKQRTVDSVFIGFADIDDKMKQLRQENQSLTQQLSRFSQVGSTIRSTLTPSLAQMDVSSIQQQPNTPSSDSSALFAEADRVVQFSQQQRREVSQQQRRGGLDVQRNLASLQANIDSVRQARANQHLNPQGSVPPVVEDDTY